MRHASRSERGFSFIEVLVVMGIIAVLAGMAVVVVGIFQRSAPKNATEATILKLKSTTDQWKAKFDGFPPMKLTDIAAVATTGAPIKKVDNSDNEPIEALFQALHWPGFGQEPELNANEISNLDDDKLPQAATARGPELHELKDGWGNPLVYFVNTQYAAVDNNPPTYLTKAGLPVQPRPWRSEGGGFVNPNGFQIFSMGEDGQPNTDDDVTSWGK
jgi:prepilin-type N-terminal cleavage/methylation domain-containing protein